MILEITLKGAIIWKALATLIFIIIVTGFIKRIFKLKMVHWILSIIGILSLILALNANLMEKAMNAFKKEKIMKETITIEKNIDQDSLNLLVEFRAENERLKQEITETKDSLIPMVLVKTDTTAESEIESEPQFKIEQAVIVQTVPFVKWRIGFPVPADGSITRGWHLPETDHGWNFRLEVNGNVIWYHNDNSFTEFLELSPKRKINLGQSNPNEMNFRFKTLDRENRWVVLEYWSK